MERNFIKSGILGLDPLLGGGFLEGSIIAVSGPTGVGKSILGMQFIIEGAKRGEPGLFIAIEESRQDLLFHFSGFNWDIEGLEKERKVMILDYPIQEVDQILNQYSAVQDIIQGIGVKRVVIDSVMPIAMYFKGQEERKTGFLKLISNIRKWGVTTLIITEDTGSTENIPKSEYGIESYTDGWVNLFYLFDDRKLERMRYAEVLKMKGVSHSTKANLASIDSTGIKIVSEPVATVLENKPAAVAQINKKSEAKKIEVPSAPEPAPVKKSLVFSMRVGPEPEKETKPQKPPAASQKELKERLDAVKEKLKKKAK